VTHKRKVLPGRYVIKRGTLITPIVLVREKNSSAQRPEKEEGKTEERVDRGVK